MYPGKYDYFFASQFKSVDTKVAFAALIGKVGGSAQTAFYPLATQRAKLMEVFLNWYLIKSPCLVIL
jgi:hypothetical protein